MAHRTTCVDEETDNLTCAEFPPSEEDKALIKALIHTSVQWKCPSDEVMRRAERGLSAFMQRCDELLGDVCYVNERTKDDPLSTLRKWGMQAATKRFPDEKDVAERERYCRYNHCLAEEELEYILPRLLCTVQSAEPPRLDDCYEVRESPLHGLGVFATKRIPAGTCIFREAPLVLVSIPRSGTTVVANVIEPQYNKLTAERKQAYARLHVGPSLGPKVRFMENVFAYNARQITSAGLMGVGESTSRVNHSCCPNAHLGQDTRHLSLRAVKNIAVGEEITINYVYMIHNRKLRRSELYARYLINCTCARCDLTTLAGRESQLRSDFLHTCLLNTQSKCTPSKLVKDSSLLNYLPKDLTYLNMILEHYEMEDVIDDSRLVYMQLYIQRLLENDRVDRAKFVAWKLYHLRIRAFGLLSQDTLRFISQIYMLFRCMSPTDYGFPKSCYCIDHVYPEKNVTAREILRTMVDDKFPLPQILGKDVKTLTTLVAEAMWVNKQDPKKEDGKLNTEHECETDLMSKRLRWERKGMFSPRPPIAEFIKDWNFDDKVGTML